MSGERERGFAQVNYLVQEQNNYSTLLLDLAKEHNNCALLLLALTLIISVLQRHHSFSAKVNDCRCKKKLSLLMSQVVY